MLALSIDCESIANFCRQHGIAELSLFGSVLRPDFRPDSDVDVLVEFEPHVRVGLFTLIRMEEQLGGLLGRRVDLVTKKALSPHIRDRVMATREILYVRAG